jgi:uncharacterized Zn finger protein
MAPNLRLVVLQPCPFCGSLNLHIVQIKSSIEEEKEISTCIECDDCGACGPPRVLDNEANDIPITLDSMAEFTGWNTRK